MCYSIETENLTKKYKGVACVKAVDLRVPDGTIYGFLGPNGAGKTTTLKMILGLVRADSGNISVLGQSMNRSNRLPILTQVGSLIESPGYYGHLTGKENMQILQVLKGLPASAVDEALHIVRLENQKDKRVDHYSLGMKQRLGFAGALLGFPKLLILDEPTNGLDPAGIQEMRELIISLPREFGITAIVSSHLLSEIDQIATNVGIIHQGELIFQDSLIHLHKRSSHQLSIRTLNNAAASLVLAQQGVETTTDEDSLLLPVMKDDAVAGLCSGLIANGIGVVRIEERCQTLEDFFLALTGNGATL